MIQELRDYRARDVTDLRSSFVTGHRAPLLAMPTAAGKDSHPCRDHPASVPERHHEPRCRTSAGVVADLREAGRRWGRSVHHCRRCDAYIRRARPGGVRSECGLSAPPTYRHRTGDHRRGASCGRRLAAAPRLSTGQPPSPRRPTGDLCRGEGEDVPDVNLIVEYRPRLGPPPRPKRTPLAVQQPVDMRHDIR